VRKCWKTTNKKGETMTSDSIPFILYTAGAMLMALVLIIAWSDRDAGDARRPAAGKRRPAYQTVRVRPGRRWRSERQLMRSYRLQHPSRGAAKQGAFGLSPRSPAGPSVTGDRAPASRGRGARPPTRGSGLAQMLGG